MRTIDINTTQNVTIQYELSELKDRFLAWLLDFTILMFGLMLLSGGLAMIFGSLMQYLFYLVIVPIFLFYTLVSEILMDGQTIGKKALGIKVVKLNGKSPSLGDYVLRWIFRSIDIYFSLGSLGALLISSSPNRQRLGGILSNTTLIKLKPRLEFKLEDILKLSSLDDYEPQYPEVRQFSEADMLTIKNAIERSRRFPNDAHRKVINELTTKVLEELDIRERPRDPIKFLKTLVSDYIVLTR